MNTKYLCAALCVMAVSCSGRFETADGQIWENIDFCIDSSVPGTRSTSPEGEESVSDLQIAVYSPSGLLCSSGEVNSGSVTLSVPVEVGGCRVAALANSLSDLGSCSSLESTAVLPASLTDNSASQSLLLTMYGTIEDLTFHSGGTCQVPVSRVPAKVEIDKIVNNIPYNPDFTVKSVYLVNVNCSSDVSGNVKSAVWKQKRGYDASEQDVTKFTYDLVNRKISYGESLDTPHIFYCCANPTEEDNSAPEWSPRYTRLVVEALYDGHTTYYPVNIVGKGNTLDSGARYVITKLTVTGPGSDSPDVPVSKLGASFSVIVNSWDNGFSQEIDY